MTPFQYARANDVADAIKLVAADPSAKFIAGGTNLIDLIKYDVEGPTRLIDISHLPLPEESVPGLLELLEGDLPSGRYEARDLPAEKEVV